jgi:pimeloyl-ACP methyl ester carboxylesterase
MSAVETGQLGDVRVRSWSGGDGQQRGLLYLHGFERHPGEAPFLARLARSRHVIAPEHPGYGESSGLDAMDHILDLVLHYRRFVEDRFDGQVDVVGHSLGGMFAAEFAAICPQVTNSLTLVSPYGLWLDEQPLPDPFLLNERDLGAAKWADPAAHPQPDPGLPAPDGGDPNAAIYDRARNMAAATKFMWPIPDHGLRRRLPFISARTLVVHPAGDSLVPRAYAEEFARLIPGAQMTTINSAGHMVMLERPEEFGDVLEKFLG